MEFANSLPPSLLLGKSGLKTKNFLRKVLSQFPEVSDLTKQPKSGFEINHQPTT